MLVYRSEKVLLCRYGWIWLFKILRPVHRTFGSNPHKYFVVSASRPDGSGLSRGVKLVFFKNGSQRTKIGVFFQNDSELGEAAWTRVEGPKVSCFFFQLTVRPGVQAPIWPLTPPTKLPSDHWLRPPGSCRDWAGDGETLPHLWHSQTGAVDVRSFYAFNCNPRCVR